MTDPRDALFALVDESFSVDRGAPAPLGASLVRGGVNFAVVSHHATGVTLVLYAPGGGEAPLELPLDPRFHRTGDVCHARVSGLAGEFEYGFRCEGPSGRGHRFEPDRVLLDPCARALAGRPRWGEPPAAGLRGVVVEPGFEWAFDQPLNTPLTKTIVYEAHVRGFTKDPSSGVAHPGTFAGLLEKIPYLAALGITAVELMPIMEFDELDVPIAANPLTGERLVNYWGYHPLAFFAPKASYAAVAAPAGAIREFKGLVRALHASGIEVILDFVFNHTGEGDQARPPLSFRGIDNATYYMVDPASGSYRDYTGCGNTLNCNHPVVRDFVVECLRYWVTEMHVDGFRFDLASVLARGRGGEVLAAPPLLEQIAADPVLAHTKLIAEAWDAAGLYQVGSFPAWGRWAEWNARFRDDVRRFVRGDAGMAGALASRLAGSPDLYRGDGRTAHHSINFVTSHDGFTLADLVSYNAKHNEENGEGSRDGSDANNSWNCGWEGPGAPAAVEALRSRQMRNLLSLLFLSQGVPMFVAGDEYARTQRGNNNAYCQDTPVSWIRWDAGSRDGSLERFVTELIAFRRDHPQLTSLPFLEPAPGCPPVAAWHGREPLEPDWSESSRLVALQLLPPDGTADLYIAANAHWEPAAVRLPDAAPGCAWYRAIDTSVPAPGDIIRTAGDQPAAGRTYEISPRSVVVLEARDRRTSR